MEEFASIETEHDADLEVDQAMSTSRGMDKNRVIYSLTQNDWLTHTQAAMWISVMKQRKGDNVHISEEQISCALLRGNFHCQSLQEFVTNIRM